MSMTTEHKRFPVAAAAIAGTLENFATFPFEYVKTQLQLQIRSSALYAGSSAYTGPLDVVQRTIRTAGLLGLYSGGASFVIFSPLRAVVRFTTAVDRQGRPYQDERLPLHTLLPL